MLGHTCICGPASPHPALVHAPLTWWLWFHGPRDADWSQGVMFSAAAAAGGGGGQIPLQTGTLRGPFSPPPFLYTHAPAYAHRQMDSHVAPASWLLLDPRHGNCAPICSRGPAGGEKGQRKQLRAPFPVPELSPLLFHAQHRAIRPPHQFFPLGKALPCLVLSKTHPRGRGPAFSPQWA